MAKKKKINVEQLQLMASAITDHRGGDVARFLEDLAVMAGSKVAISGGKDGKSRHFKFAGIEGAPSRLGGRAGDWEALDNWANAARRAVVQEA